MASLTGTPAALADFVAVADLPASTEQLGRYPPPTSRNGCWSGCRGPTAPRWPPRCHAASGRGSARQGARRGTDPARPRPSSSSGTSGNPDRRVCVCVSSFATTREASDDQDPADRLRRRCCGCRSRLRQGLDERHRGDERAHHRRANSGGTNDGHASDNRPRPPQRRPPTKAPHTNAPPTTKAPTTTPPQQMGGPHRCTTSDLWRSSRVSAPRLATSTARSCLTNHSGATCTIYGYGGIGLVGAPTRSSGTPRAAGDGHPQGRRSRVLAAALVRRAGRQREQPSRL